MNFSKLILALCLISFAKKISAQTSPFDSVNILLQKRIYFDFGKYDLNESSVNTLLQISDSCIGKANFKLHVEAHTDYVGSSENNLTLSQNRGQAVKDYFIQQQISASKISTSVFGESNPVADNTSDDGRQQNRRAAVSLFIQKKMTKVKGKVVDKKTGEGMSAKIIFRNKNFRDSVMTAADGSFEKAVEENTIVGVDIFKEGYFFDTQMLKAKAKNTVVMTIPLLPIEVGEKVAIKNLYYVGNKAVLLPKSKPELPKVLKFMQLNPDLKIEIAGHINAPFRTLKQLEQREHELSTNRAKVIYDYLVEHQISADRLTFKGYSNTQMIYPRARSLEHQASNRRVEIRILETGTIVSEVEN